MRRKTYHWGQCSGANEQWSNRDVGRSWWSSQDESTERRWPKRRKRVSDAAWRLLDAAQAPPAPSKFRYLDTAPHQEEVRPLVAKSRWRRLPYWIAMYAERNTPRPMCFFGHELRPADAPRFSSCYRCGAKPIPQGSPILWCRTCDFWSLCGDCAAFPRLPNLQQDPLFHGADHPCLFDWASCMTADTGTIIVCPGGNYEFLCPNEALPVVAWLKNNGIYATVLRYRLLPAYRHSDALSDLKQAIRLIRSTRRGPVVAVGFSAGGHLIASLAIKRELEGEHEWPALDGQVLIYPGIDGSDWLDRDTCGFFNADGCLANSHTLVVHNQSLCGGRGFAAPPTFMVASIYDKTTPPEKHCDLYEAALRSAGVPYEYLRRDFGDHGFGLEGGWTDECIAWLRWFGFGC